MSVAVKPLPPPEQARDDRAAAIIVSRANVVAAARDLGPGCAGAYLGMDQADTPAIGERQVDRQRKAAHEPAQHIQIAEQTCAQSAGGKPAQYLSRGWAAVDQIAERDHPIHGWVVTGYACQAHEQIHLPVDVADDEKASAAAAPRKPRRPSDSSHQASRMPKMHLETGNGIQPEPWRC